MKLKTTTHKPTFADEISRIMSAKGITDHMLSEKTGYAADTHYRHRIGKMVPPMIVRKLVLEILNKWK